VNLQELWQRSRSFHSRPGFSQAFTQLLEHHFHLPRLSIWTRPDLELSPDRVSAFTADLDRYCQDTPLAHLTGQTEFFGLPFVVTSAVLIPRPDTEHLVKAALAIEPAPALGLDIGCGSGILAVTLARHLPDILFDAVDSSWAALQIARLNACRNGVSSRIRFHHADLFPSAGSLPETGYDLILSNPPYIDAAEMEQLDPSVRDHEPDAALFGGPDGLDFYRRILERAGTVLRPGGNLLFEVGWKQARIVAGLMQQQGFQDLRIMRDFGGVERVVRGRRSD
jgi:release factor glutamine methyltransferase